MHTILCGRYLSGGCYEIFKVRKFHLYLFPHENLIC